MKYEGQVLEDWSLDDESRVLTIIEVMLKAASCFNFEVLE
jgi:hypothetical protein